MDQRELKALEIAAKVRLTCEGGVWAVPSQRGKGKYQVSIGPDGSSCTCEDFQLRREACKHIIAVRIVKERDHGGQPVPLDTEVIIKKPSYPQNWPAYNLAQTTEKHRFQILLADLCKKVPQLPQPWTGRKRTPTADAVFATTFKVYSTFSSRRFMCDLKDAHAKGHLTKPIHYNSVNNYLENKELAAILSGLIERSSLPLKAVETDFAVDSSGFTTSRFIRWHDQKYGVTRSGHDWVKVHLMCGVKTNVVTAVEIFGRDAADSPVLPSLIVTTAKTFQMKEVSADKGYSSVENIEAIAEQGALPYIAFKVNTTGASGGLWESMFHYYNLRREEFLTHYHKRSNVESTFSMIKAKFRDHIRSRTDSAMVNEALCKILCHNICCVIMSQCELGIEPVFWEGS